MSDSIWFWVMIIQFLNSSKQKEEKKEMKMNFHMGTRNNFPNQNGQQNDDDDKLIKNHS